MGLLDFFKKKKKPSAVAKATEGKKIEKKVEKRAEAKPEIKRPRKKVSGITYRTLLSAHVTEKATGLEAENKYVFKVLAVANKNEIKKAIENLYGVEVINIKIINIPKKQRRLGKQKGWRKGYKKAVIRIKKGQRIEVMPR